MKIPTLNVMDVVNNVMDVMATESKSNETLLESSVDGVTSVEIKLQMLSVTLKLPNDLV